MSFWDNVKKFAQPYADDEFDEFDDVEDGFEDEAEPAPIRRGGGFVADQQLGSIKQCLSDAQPLLHAPGETLDAVLFIAQTHQFQQFLATAFQL